MYFLFIDTYKIMEVRAHERVLTTTVSSAHTQWLVWYYVQEFVYETGILSICKSIYKEFFLARCVTLIETLSFFNVNTYVDTCIKICSDWYDDSNTYELILSFPYIMCGKFSNFRDKTWKYFCVVWKLIDNLCQNVGQAKNMSATDLFSH